MTYHAQFLLLVLAGWVNRQQQDVIDYLQEENHFLLLRWPGFINLVGTEQSSPSRRTPAGLDASVAERIPART